MRRALIFCLLASLAAVARADPPPPPDPALADYPAAAKAAGVEGAATLTCARDAHMALKGCVVVSETPAGQGFGQAALAMAARSPDNPALDVHDPRLVGPQTLTVAFSLHPPGVDPDLSQMAHLIANPRLLQAPTPRDMWAYYPAAAFRALVSGHVTLRCAAGLDGRLSACAVTEETPRGQSFGRAALRLARLYSVSPMKRDGVAIEGAEVSAPIAFDAADAAFASLEPGDEPAGAAAQAPNPARHWLRAPTARDIEQVYPESAVHANLWGRAVLRCTVAQTGALRDCAVASQTPSDRGFGAAALELAPQFRLDVAAPLGDPADVGAQISVPIGFEIAERCGNCPAPGR